MPQFAEYQRGAAGRAAYTRARARAQARTPTDPQHATGGPALPELRALCACGHANCVHTLGTRKGHPVVTWCTVMTAAGPCGCRLFTPGDNPVGD